jgi:hypothetical protein
VHSNEKTKEFFHYFSPGKSGKFFIVFLVVFYLELFPETKAQRKVKNKELEMVIFLL